MEVLSIGEKIKKLRTERGVRLKDICSENLSISKISCIENNKIRPDEYSLRILADKLGTSYEYLSKDITDQVYANISFFDVESFDSNIFEKYKYNLFIAVEHKIYDLVFEICNNIFSRFIFEKNCDLCDEDIIEIIPIYFNSLLGINKLWSNLIYSLDLAMYFFVKKEYSMASHYFRLLRELSSKQEVLKQYRDVIIVCEMNCYIEMRDYDKLYLFRDVIRIDDFCISEYFYDVLYFNVIWEIKYDFKNIKNKDIFHIFQKCCFERRKQYIYSVSCVLYDLGYVNESLHICERLYYTIRENKIHKDTYLTCKILVYISKVCVENMYKREVKDIVEYSLDFCIVNNCCEYIFELYFYKSLIHVREDDFDKASLYINLCTYLLNQVRDKVDNEKYLNIGFLLYKLGDAYQAIRSFGFISEREM